MLLYSAPETRIGYAEANTEKWPPNLTLNKDQHDGQDYQILACDRQTLIWRTRPPHTPMAIYKLYHHRGAVSWVREHLAQFRVEREFHALAYLYKNGISCSKPLLWMKGKKAEYGGRFEVLVTEEIANAVSLYEYLKSPPYQGLQALLEACGHLVRQMHSKGVYHGALYTRNLLLGSDEEGHVTPYIIDMPKTVIYPFDIKDRTPGVIDLMNLTRTLQESKATEVCQWFLRAYGLPDSAISAFITKVTDFNPGKHTRNYHRAYTGLLKFASRWSKNDG